MTDFKARWARPYSMSAISSRLDNACIAFITAAVCRDRAIAVDAPGYGATRALRRYVRDPGRGVAPSRCPPDRMNKIRCRATYDSQASGNDLKLALRCASDSYNVDFRGNAINSGGNMTGNWFEETNQVAGQFFGSIKGNRIDARIEGQTFAAFFNMTTHGNRQSVSLRSPGSRVSNVTIALTRR